MVAIGASGGGLVAFTALHKSLPANTGKAFVWISRKEPANHRARAGLLSKSTAMPVVEASHGIAIEPNHVYTIPPNKNMTIAGGTLRLWPLDGPRPQRSIDEFFAALAEAQGDAAVGILLSGTGSDGTSGLKMIKAAGGGTFAQEPKTARWPRMPMNAIAAGAVDRVLPPKQIAGELARVDGRPKASKVPATIDFRKEAERILLNRITSPALIVDPDLRIVHFQGDTSRYLSPAKGRPSLHLLKMIRCEMMMDMRAVNFGARKKVAAEAKDVVFEQNGQSVAIRLGSAAARKHNGNKSETASRVSAVGDAGGRPSEPGRHHGSLRGDESGHYADPFE